MVKWLRLDEIEGPVVEIGCGYGTFTVPVARGARFDVYAFDIDSSMLEIAERNVRNANVRNVKLFQRDVVSDGTGMVGGAAAMVLLFNILHSKERRVLLKEAGQGSYAERRRSHSALAERHCNSSGSRNVHEA